MDDIDHHSNPVILIADDDRVLRKLLARALNQDGYESIQVGSGEQVLQDFQRLRPDLVLLDAVMPDGDGFDCCRRLRREFQSEIPILIVTVLDDQASIDRAFEVGATDYITKPIHWSVLRQRVRRLLQSHQAIAQAQQTHLALATANAWESLQRAILWGASRKSPIDQILVYTCHDWETSLGVQRVGLFSAHSETLWKVYPEPMQSPDDELIFFLKSLKPMDAGPQQFLISGEAATPVATEMEKVMGWLGASALLLVPLIWKHEQRGWLLLGRDRSADWSEVVCDRSRDLGCLLAIALSTEE